MSYLRNKGLRRLVASLFLLSGLSVQVQTLFACTLMDGEPMTECCCGADMETGCDMGGGCGSESGHTATDCCDVTVTVELQDTAVDVATVTRLVSQLKAPQPPPAILLTPDSLFTQPKQSATPYPNDSPPIGSEGTHTYLLTHRLRI